MIGSPYQNYSSSDLKFKKPGDILVSYFKQAAEHMAEAAKGILAGNIEKRYEESQKASAIISGLSYNLYRETPEALEASQNLDNYYNSFILMIVQMNLKNDLELCEEIRKSFEDMAQTWKEATIKYESMVSDNSYDATSTNIST